MRPAGERRWVRECNELGQPENQEGKHTALGRKNEFGETLGYRHRLSEKFNSHVQFYDVPIGLSLS